VTAPEELESSVEQQHVVAPAGVDGAAGSAHVAFAGKSDLQQCGEEEAGLLRVHPESCPSQQPAEDDGIAREVKDLPPD
jgi:hypothetical protein